MSRSPNSDHFTLGRFLRPYAARLGVLGALMVLGIFLGLVHPWVLQQLIDRVLLARRPDLLWVFGAVLGGAATLRFGLGVLQAWMYTGVTSRILFDMRRDFLAHLQRLSLRFFAGRPFGDVITRFNRDLTQLQEIATGALLGFLTNALTLIGVIGWALYYDARLLVLAAAPFPIGMLVARAFRGRITRLTERLRELASGLASIVVETITGMRTVRAHGRERSELKRFMAHGHVMIRTLLTFRVTHSLATGLPRLCLVAASITVYIVGGRDVIRGEKSLGSLVAIGMYIGMLFAPLMALLDLYLQLVQARVSLGRVRAIRDMPAEIVDAPNAVRPGRLRGEVAFEGVGFRYRREVPLLEDLSFRLAPGENVVLVGASGAGKSTVVDLLMRFLDPDHGRVTIDGHDLRALQLAPLRRQMALVSQAEHLFNDTILANVRFGAPRASEEDVHAAADAAGVTAFAQELPQGLDTLVGERGLELSGGERQRVSIARALLRKPVILVLDEATSALDRAADRTVRTAVQTLARQATTLVISHNERNLEGADRVLRLEAGRIVEEP